MCYRTGEVILCFFFSKLVVLRAILEVLFELCLFRVSAGFEKY